MERGKMTDEKARREEKDGVKSVNSEDRKRIKGRRKVRKRWRPRTMRKKRRTRKG